MVFEKKMLFSHDILIQLTQVSALLRLSNGYTCLICINISRGNIHISNTIKNIYHIGKQELDVCIKFL